VKTLQNRLFSDLLGKHGISVRSVLEQPSQETSTIYLVDGCYTRSPVAPNQINIATCFDQTEVECAVNHEHLSAGNTQEVQKLMEEVSGLKRSMEEQYPDVPFRIIASFQDDGATIRFHKVRPGEEWTNLSNLEGYLKEAVFVITVGPESDVL